MHGDNYDFIYKIIPIRDGLSFECYLYVILFNTSFIPTDLFYCADVEIYNEMANNAYTHTCTL